MRTIAILGSTGSIGTGVLDVVDRLPGAFQVTGLAAGGNVALLSSQMRKYRPRVVSVTRRKDAESMRGPAKVSGTRVTWGPEGAEEVAGGVEAEVVVSAITGMNGFRPTLAAVRSGRIVALANKESMVVGGALLQREAVRSGARIVPVDSEHSGVFQCLRKERRSHVGRVILTASGGPFFRTPLRDLGRKSPDEALRHPRWKMGRKVTVDSATLMNKGLELIEARWLFGLEPERLDVLVHPQSAVHCLVEMRDGSVLAQLSATDMRIPIQYALTYPKRTATSLPRLDLASLGRLEFFRVEARRYPLFETAQWALIEGESLPVALNAANEIAVAAFLGGKLGFSGIAETVRRVMDSHRKTRTGSVEDISRIDREARRRARAIIRKKD